MADDARDSVRCRRIQYLGTHKRALFGVVQEAGPDGIDANERMSGTQSECRGPRLNARSGGISTGLRSLTYWRRVAEHERVGIESDRASYDRNPWPVPSEQSGGLAGRPAVLGGGHDGQ